MASEILEKGLQKLKAYKEEITPSIKEVLNNLLAGRVGGYLGKIFDFEKYKKPFNYIAYALLAAIAAGTVITEIIFSPFIILGAILVKLILPYLNQFLDWTYNLFSGYRFKHLSTEGWSEGWLFFGRVPRVAMAMIAALISKPQHPLDWLLKPIQLFAAPFLVAASAVQELAIFGTTLRGAIILVLAPVAITVSVGFCVLMAPYYIMEALRPYLGLKKREVYNPDGYASPPGGRGADQADVALSGSQMDLQINRSSAAEALANAVPVLGPLLEQPAVPVAQAVVASEPTPHHPPVLMPAAKVIAPTAPPLIDLDLEGSNVNPYIVPNSH